MKKKQTILNFFSRFNLLAVFIFVYITGSCYWIFTQNILADETFAAQNTCPACIGETFCRRLQTGSVTISSLYKLYLFDLSSVAARYVTKRGVTDVLLHRLQSSQAFDDLDLRICINANMAPGCKPSLAILKSPAIKDLKTFMHSFKNSPSTMFHCPSTRLFERMLATNKELTSFDESDKSKRFSQLWTTAHVSPVPLLLQMFPASDGWPFPVYYGACGRLFVTDNNGESLASYQKAPWNIRVILALELIQLADRLTNNKDDFALYMLDVTFDSFRVTTEGHVILTDLQSILVVDQQAVKSANPKHWEDVYETPFSECTGKSSKTCHVHSETEMCSHVISDHNYYVICRNILTRNDDANTKGLLSYVPEAVNNDWDLEYLLSECVMPRRQRGRLQIVHKLIDALTSLQNTKYP